MAPSGKIHEEVWEYGLVAEVPHIGPYKTEAADIAALKGFVARNGFRVKDGPEES
jgi:hypothetical protein